MCVQTSDNAYSLTCSQFGTIQPGYLSCVLHWTIRHNLHLLWTWNHHIVLYYCCKATYNIIWGMFCKWNNKNICVNEASARHVIMIYIIQKTTRDDLNIVPTACNYRFAKWKKSDNGHLTRDIARVWASIITWTISPL